MRTRPLLALALAATLIGVAACERGEPDPPADTRPPTGSSVQNLGDREYRLYVPSSVTRPASLVVMMHGGFGSAEQAEESYGWGAAADRYGFVVAFPDGIGRAWSVGGGCCGEPGRDGVDDVAFVEAVVADVAGRLPIDPRRVYATGMSNGALMSYRLACDSDVFAAIAPVAGTLLGDCPRPRPVSVLHIHGLADENVRFDGAPGSGFAKIDGPPVESTVDIWRAADGCTAPTVTTAGPVTTYASACAAGRAVTLVTIAGAGHQWPGSPDRTLAQRILGLDPPSDALDATDASWRFFAAHPGS
jgi:polyhydroxybutyrate depolymerase